MKRFYLISVLVSLLFTLSCASSKNTDNNSSTNNTNNSNNINNNNNTGPCSTYCPSDKVCVGESDEHSTCVSACPCPADKMCYNGGCVDLFSDENNCGSGGNYCSGDCVNGQCTDACASAGTPCGNGETCCNLNGIYTCKNTDTDMYNCGGCGTVCDSVASNACVGGQCACGTSASCTTGRTCCSNSCKDLDTDVYNCGSCGNACGVGLSCSGGQCMCGSVACGFGEECCGNYCANTDNDPTNCGSCGNDCGTGNGCSGGACTCGTSSEVCHPEGEACGLMGELLCNTECCNDGCKNTTTEADPNNPLGLMSALPADPENCGSCGTSCGGQECCCASDPFSGTLSCSCCAAGETCQMGGCAAAQK